jgi:hypothetical protein
LTTRFPACPEKEPTCTKIVVPAGAKMEIWSRAPKLSLQAKVTRSDREVPV